MKIEIDVEIPEGYEATGEYRTANGEPIISDGEFREEATTDFYAIILRKKTRKVIAFVEVCSFEEATPANDESNMRWGLANGWTAPAVYSKTTSYKIDRWLRREEREEPCA